MKFSKPLIWGLLFLFFLCSGSAIARDIYVGPNDNCRGATGVRRNPYCTLREAVNHANNGDTIILLSGYTSNEDILITKRLTIKSEGDGATIGRPPIFFENYYTYRYPRDTTSSVAGNAKYYKEELISALDNFFSKQNTNESIRLCESVLPALNNPWDDTPENIKAVEAILKERLAMPYDPLTFLESDLSFADRPNSVLTPAAVFAFYYYERFVIPMLLADAYTDVGNHEEAINQALSVYGEDTFFQASTDDNLEKWEKYGTSRGPRIEAGHTHESIVRSKLYGYIEGAAAPNPALNDIEKKYVTLKIAKIYLKWGEFLYRNEKFEKAKSKYMQVLRIYHNIWNDIIKDGKQNNAKYNPAAVEMVLTAHRELIKLAGRLNYLGYRNDYVPIWTYSFLRQSATYFTNQAKNLERDGLSFKASAEGEIEKKMLAQHSLSIAQKMVELEKAKVEQSRTSVLIANKSVDLVTTKLKNNKEQKDLFKAHHPNAVSKFQDHQGKLITDLGNKKNPVYGKYGDSVTSETFEEVLRAGFSAVPYWGSFTNTVFADWDKEKAEAEQYQRLLHEEQELVIAEKIASAEVIKSMQSLAIDSISQQIAQLEVANKEAHLSFIEHKALNEQFWYELSKNIREKAHQYLGYAICQAWLTQRAFNFEYLTNVNIIKLDYLSSEKWLAADQLLLDLDTIEHQRVITQKEKDIPVTHYLSLRQKNLLDLQSLKNTGNLVFNTTQQDFDFAYPGTYNRRIKSVEVLILALVGPEGVRGSLTKTEYSLVKTYEPETTPDDSTVFTDWMKYESSPSRLRLLRAQEETLVLSAYDPGRTNGVINAAAEGQKNIFEGHGVEGTWILQLPKYANTFNYDTIMDVILKINFTAHYNEELKNVIELERRKRMGLGEFPMGNIIGTSMKLDFPDQFYYFHNPIGDPGIYTKTRFMPFLIDKDLSPHNETFHKLQKLYLGFYGDDGPIQVKAQITSKLMNPGSDLSIVDGRFNYDDPTIIDALKWFPKNVTRGRYLPIAHPLTGEISSVAMTDTLQNLGAQLFDLWVLRIDAADNSSLCTTPGVFDQDKFTKIKDIMVQFEYSYELSGIDGAPIELFADFSTSMNFSALPGGYNSGVWTKSSEQWKWDSKSQALSYNNSRLNSITAPSYSLPREFEFSMDFNNLKANGWISLILHTVSSDYEFHFRAEVDPGRFTNNKRPWEIIAVPLGISETRFFQDDEHLNLKIAIRTVSTPSNNQSRLIKFYLDSELIKQYIDESPSALTGQFHIKASKEALFDNIMITNLAGRTSVSPF